MNESTQLNELFGSLAKAQAEFGMASSDNANPFFKSKYASLAEVVKVSRPALTKYGLAVVQSVQVKENGQQVLLSILGHSSGQCLSSEMIINPVKNDPQGLGSCITYLRRYCYAALVGVVVGEEDDDGNHASDVSKPKATYTQKPSVIGDEGAKVILQALEDNPAAKDLADSWLKALNITRWYALPQAQYDAVLQKIKTTK